MSSSNRARFLFLVASWGVQAVTLSALAEPNPAPGDDCAQAFENAQKLRKDGKLKAAAEASIACSQPSCPTFIAKECTNVYSEVQSSLPSFTVRATEGRDKLITDVAVYLDGELLTKTIDGRAVPVDPGVHDFRFVSKDKPEQSLKVLVAEGEKNKIVSVDFAPPETKSETPNLSIAAPVAPADVPKEHKQGPPLASYVLGGIGVVAIGAGVVFRLVADKDYDDAERSCSPGCSKSTTDSIDLKYNLSIASFAVGGAAVASAAVVWLVKGSGSSGSTTAQTLSVRPLAGNNGMVALWRGNF